MSYQAIYAVSVQLCRRRRLRVGYSIVEANRTVCDGQLLRHPTSFDAAREFVRCVGHKAAFRAARSKTVEWQE